MYIRGTWQGQEGVQSNKFVHLCSSYQLTSHCSEFSYNLSTCNENNRSNVSATTVAFIRDEYKNQNLKSENALRTHSSY